MESDAFHGDFTVNYSGDYLGKQNKSNAGLGLIQQVFIVVILLCIYWLSDTYRSVARS